MTARDYYNEDGNYYAPEDDDRCRQEPCQGCPECITCEKSKYHYREEGD